MTKNTASALFLFSLSLSMNKNSKIPPPPPSLNVIRWNDFSSPEEVPPPKSRQVVDWRSLLEVWIPGHGVIDEP